MKLVRTLANLWLMLFWAATAMGCLDEVLALASGIHLLLWPRGTLEAITWLTLPWIWVGLGLGLLSSRVFLLPMWFGAWLVVGASPVSILLYGKAGLGPALMGLQLAVAAGTAWQVQRLDRGGRFFLQREAEGEDAPPLAVSWRRFAGWTVGHALFVPLLLAVYGFGSVDLALRQATGGFVSLGLDGVRITHRAYVRGDQVVDLVGMIHLGDGDAYREIFVPIPIEGTLILEEGVRDRKGLLPGGGTYDRVAGRLGIEAQRPIHEITRHLSRNADVDVSDFSEDTREFLGKVFAIYTAEDPAAAMLDYLLFMRGKPDQEALLRAVMADILDRRNAHLLHELQEALDRHERVVIPWGAYHLPDLEKAILADGFIEDAERKITLIPFRRSGE